MKYLWFLPALLLINACGSQNSLESYINANPDDKYLQSSDQNNPLTQQPSTNPPSPTPSTSTFDLELLSLINQHRQSISCPTLTQNPVMNEVARLHSVDMAQMDDLTHTGSDGSNFAIRLTRAGIALTYTGSSENILYTSWSATGDEAFNAWINSTGHKRNIENCFSTQIGIGMAINQSSGKHYYTNVFN